MQPLFISLPGIFFKLMTVHSVLLWGHSKHLVSSIMSPAGDRPPEAPSLDSKITMTQSTRTTPHCQGQDPISCTEVRPTSESKHCTWTRRCTQLHAHASPPCANHSEPLLLYTFHSHSLPTRKQKHSNMQTSLLGIKGSSRSFGPTSLAQEHLTDD